MTSTRRLPVGAEPTAGGVHFRVWAPDHDSIDVILDDGRTTALQREAAGYFSGFVADAHAGARYRYRLPDGRRLPDPASRFQPDGPHEHSQVIDPAAFAWTDSGWRGVEERKHVVYELHIGTFTCAGTWHAAREHIAYLADLGVSVIELMPVSEFDGPFNWGYDGVAPFAPAHVYGHPHDMRTFVDAAHAAGIAVILDVVYNHMGPSGCYMRDYADAYFSRRYKTDWGDALNFDDAASRPVREFVLSNVEYWIREFHIDGLRVDATQNISDAGTPHILAELTARARAAAAPRRVWIVAENEPQDRRIFDEFHFDAAWNDDFHHSAQVALTGRREAYYTDYAGSPQELISTAKWGFLFQGQHCAWQKKRRGTPVLDQPRRHFVHYLQNHDQTANSARGERIDRLTSPGALRAITALLHLMPQHVMLFQGQEFNASSPFEFFAGHRGALARTVHQGRRDFLAQFPSIASDDVLRSISDPAAPETFQRSQLDHDERNTHRHVLQLHRDLIRLARGDTAFSDPGDIHGAVLGATSFALRWLNGADDDRLLLMNLGDDLTLHGGPEPLLGLPHDRQWRIVLGTEDPAYGGAGIPRLQCDDVFTIAARSALVLKPEPITDGDGRS